MMIHHCHQNNVGLFLFAFLFKLLVGLSLFAFFTRTFSFYVPLLTTSKICIFVCIEISRFLAKIPIIGVIFVVLLL